MTLDKKKILLVEENPGYTRLFQETFLRYGADEFTLVHEDSLQNALKRLSEEKIDLVLLDLLITETSGTETLMKFQEIDSTAPIVALTGYCREKVSLYAPRWAPVIISPKNIWRGNILVSALRHYTD